MILRALPIPRLLLVGLLFGVLSRALAQDEAAARHAGVEAVYPVMMKALEEGDIAQARTLCEHVILMEPQSPVHRYNLACIEARAGGAMLPRALAALEQAVQLGFNDLNGLRSDPDLAAIRRSPKFAALVRLVESRASPSDDDDAPAAGQSEAAPAEPATAAPAPKRAAKPATVGPIEKPPAASLKKGVPVGLYFMTRFWPATGSLEKAAWYFAPDGAVYENLEHGFSVADLAAHTGSKGTCHANGNLLEVSWNDGKKTSSQLKENSRGFSWNGGIFTAAQSFESAVAVAGTYEGGESLSTAASRAIVSKRLQLRADGTFVWTGVSFAGATSDTSQVWAGSTGGGSTGTWQVSSHSLILVDADGNVFRRIAFPYDDQSTPITPDWIFFGGMMYKRQP